MWRNVSWNSNETSLPDGLHKHETGAYFKTPSIQSATTEGSCELQQAATGACSPAEDGSRADERTKQPSGTRTAAASAAREERTGSASSASARQRNPRLKDSSHKQQASLIRSANDTQKHQPAGGKSTTAPANQHHQQQPHGFRSRLSSISDALHSQKLTKRLFSGGTHPETTTHEPHKQPPPQQQPIQITTTSIDSPQHSQQQQQQQSPSCSSADRQQTTGMESDEHLFHQYHQQQQQHHHLSRASGRRLSQLFLPQVTSAPTLLGQDPYAPGNELIPPHLLGLYGQPPLVGGGGCGGGSSTSGGSSFVGGGQHRASWADTSLLGRLSNFRPSIDSAAYHGGPGSGAGQVRHSFDARKYSPQISPSLASPRLAFAGLR